MMGVHLIIRIYELRESACKNVIVVESLPNFLVFSWFGLISLIEELVLYLIL